MAVVFISPKQKQKTFFIGITVMFLLLLIIIFLVVFLYSPKLASPELVFNKPKVNIDIKFFDSEQFKNFDRPFIKIPLQFSYKATTKDRVPKTRTGFVSADSIDLAREAVVAMNLDIVELKEVEIGRDNPFTPYYTPPALRKTR